MLNVKEMIAANRAGVAVGLPCFCTANAHVLRAVLAYAARTGSPAVIEATCNQVNQDGGYTGMVPADFMNWLRDMASDAGVAMEQVIVGGDHLGPNPWRNLPVERAMAKARTLVQLYAQAGFRKIHLDASMALGGEAAPSFATIAERAADLCAIAEVHAPHPEELIYIIGTEVPIPGGETEEPDALDVTSVARFHETLSTHREAFVARGLDAAWGKIVGVVTQPGVDFSHTTVFRFDRGQAAPLARAILNEPAISYEAHSTDYQPSAALSDLVASHFFFLKVGPELTLRFREAIYALADIEEWMTPTNPSNIKAVISAQMDKKNEYWREYYRGAAETVERLKVFSYSDRIRYYWSQPPVADALARLITNLQNMPLPETIISQSFCGLEFGEIPKDPAQLIENHVQRCVERYYRACGGAGAMAS